MSKAQPPVIIHQLRERSKLSPADKDGPTFLIAADMLEKHAEELKKFRSKVELLDDSLGASREVIDAQNAVIKEREQQRHTARLERDQFRLVLARCPKLPDSFDLRALADFCEQLKRWQEGPCAEVLQDYPEEIDYGNGKESEQESEQASESRVPANV